MKQMVANTEDGIIRKNNVHHLIYVFTVAVWMPYRLCKLDFSFLEKLTKSYVCLDSKLDSRS